MTGFFVLFLFICFWFFLLSFKIKPLHLSTALVAIVIKKKTFEEMFVRSQQTQGKIDLGK